MGITHNLCCLNSVLSYVSVVHRFADFIEGSPHLLSNEVSVHTQEYGLGGSFFEDELFSTDEEIQEEEEGWETDDGVKPEVVSPRWNNTRVIK